MAGPVLFLGLRPPWQTCSTRPKSGVPEPSGRSAEGSRGMAPRGGRQGRRERCRRMLGRPELAKFLLLPAAAVALLGVVIVPRRPPPASSIRSTHSGRTPRQGRLAPKNGRAAKQAREELYDRLSPAYTMTVALRQRGGGRRAATGHRLLPAHRRGRRLAGGADAARRFGSAIQARRSSPSGGSSRSAATFPTTMAAAASIPNSRTGWRGSRFATACASAASSIRGRLPR